MDKIISVAQGQFRLPSLEEWMMLWRLYRNVEVKLMFLLNNLTSIVDY